jgi:predicted NAD-dependent protein-ADP-ribosyltransferase YbiA (DUF1768 family)
LDVEQKEEAKAKSPGMAKKMGSRDGYRGFRIELRPDWEEIKLAVMERILWEKFSQNPGLGAQFR